jgi:hypothetical protein
MNPVVYIKAVIGAVGASIFPPIADWAMTFIPAPPNVRSALSLLVVALLTGGAVYATPNKTTVSFEPKSELATVGK